MIFFLITFAQLIMTGRKQRALPIVCIFFATLLWAILVFYLQILFPGTPWERQRLNIVSAFPTITLVLFAAEVGLAELVWATSRTVMYRLPQLRPEVFRNCAFTEVVLANWAMWNYCTPLGPVWTMCTVMVLAVLGAIRDTSPDEEEEE